jgi:hypothetical protein
MCGGEKPLKVKVLNNKSSAYRGHIHYGGVIYKTGEVLDIKDKDYDPKIFMKISGSPEKEEPTSPITIETSESVASEPLTALNVTIPEPTKEPSQAEQSKPKKTRRKI